MKEYSIEVLAENAREQMAKIRDLIDEGMFAISGTPKTEEYPAMIHSVVAAAENELEAEFFATFDDMIIVVKLFGMILEYWKENGAKFGIIRFNERYHCKLVETKPAFDLTPAAYLIRAIYPDDYDEHFCLVEVVIPFGPNDKDYPQALSEIHAHLKVIEE